MDDKTSIIFAIPILLYLSYYGKYHQYKFGANHQATKKEKLIIQKGQCLFGDTITSKASFEMVLNLIFGMRMNLLEHNKCLRV